MANQNRRSRRHSSCPEIHVLSPENKRITEKKGNGKDQPKVVGRKNIPKGKKSNIN